MKKTLVYKIKKGWRSSIPFTVNYFLRKFHRIECKIIIPIHSNDNRKFRVFGIKHGIYLGRKLEVIIKNDFIKTLDIILNDAIVYRYKFCSNIIELQIEYTARDFLKQILIVIPNEDIFIFKYTTTERINKLFTPHSENKLTTDQYVLWEIIS